MSRAKIIDTMKGQHMSPVYHDIAGRIAVGCGNRSMGGVVMSPGVVWLFSTVALWAICTACYTAIEGLVPGYRTRFAVMIVAGVAVGALASAFGYSFSILSIILFAQLMVVRRGFLRFFETEGQQLATKYMAPMIGFVVAATIGSYAFSLESCDASHRCHRMIFERIYTPPPMP